MRKTIATFVAVVVMAVPSVAMAAPPEVLFDGTEEFSGEVPAGVLCDSANQLDETVKVRVTAFYDNEGNPTTERIHIAATPSGPRITERSKNIGRSPTPSI